MDSGFPRPTRHSHPIWAWYLLVQGCSCTKYPCQVSCTDWGWRDMPLRAKLYGALKLLKRRPGGFEYRLYRLPCTRTERASRLPSTAASGGTVREKTKAKIK